MSLSPEPTKDMKSPRGLVAISYFQEIGIWMELEHFVSFCMHILRAIQLQ